MEYLEHQKSYYSEVIHKVVKSAMKESPDQFLLTFHLVQDKESFQQ